MEEITPEEYNIISGYLTACKRWLIVRLLQRKREKTEQWCLEKLKEERAAWGIERRRMQDYAELEEEALRLWDRASWGAEEDE